MALFPRIQSPCPYKDDLSVIMDGDMCRLCKRQVFDLTDLSDSQRVALIDGCAASGVGEICISYRLPAHLALAAAVAMGALTAPMAAAAQEVTEVIVTGGGIKDLKKVEYVRVPDQGPAAELPVVYEDRSPNTASAKAGSRKDVSSSAAPVSRPITRPGGS